MQTIDLSELGLLGRFSALNYHELRAIIFATILLLALSAAGQSQKDQRMKWWREARFGLFIHWGLYAIPAGEWGGQTNYGEWIRNNAQIPLTTYDKFLTQFNPVKFNANEWVSMAKNAGMKYIVITTKHHDGFALFDSKVSDFDVMATPFKRDILKELAAACKKYDMRLCFYHSIMDWHHPDYLPRRLWEKDRPTANADFDRYVTYMKEQLKELLTNYGDIGVLWFDGEWEGTWTHERGQDLYEFVRLQQPAILVNNRVDKGREGMQGNTKDGFTGDFGTPEQEIPATGIPGVDWESCMTMNGNWGYNKNDNNWKSPEDLVQKLIDIASKGGNFLLNVGPTAEGVFPQASIDRLQAIGEWMKINGGSIYATEASPFKTLAWGRVTQKNIKGNTRLYLHVFDWPKNNQLLLPGLGSEVLDVRALAGSAKLPFNKNGNDYTIDISGAAKQKFATVIIVDLKGKAIVYTEPKITAPAIVFIDQLPVSFSTDIPDATIRYTTDGTEPTAKSFIASQPVYINQSVTIKAKVFNGENALSPTATASYKKAVPAAAKNVTANNAGLKYAVYDGKWNKLPDFSQLKPALSGTVKSIDISARQGKEEYAYVFEGFVKVPADGVYTFFVSSDDGSKLWIDDVLIDNDGPHGLTEKSAEIPLAKGLHSIKLQFFENSGSDELYVHWKGPGFEKIALPGPVLFY
jgi:alpha-L-fucosidase